MPSADEAKIVTGKDGKLRLENFYTPFADAKKEIFRRWNDKKLRNKVTSFLKGDIPEVLESHPKSVLARHVVSPHFELLRFLKLSEVIGLDPVCLEYVHDKFVAENIDKYHLCKLFFHHNKKKCETDVAATLNIIDFNKAQGKKISALRTIWNESIVDFHHKLNDKAKLSSKVDFYDISEHYKRNGAVANKYYAYFFTLFVCHGVLFENYLLNKEQVDFTVNDVLVNFRKISSIFGLKPLVVQLGPAGEEENLYWRYYPMYLKKIIDNDLKK